MILENLFSLKQELKTQAIKCCTIADVTSSECYAHVKE